MQLADEDGYPRHGFIESMDNRVNPATGLAYGSACCFQIPTGALVPGLFARVRLPVSAPADALLVSETRDRHGPEPENLSSPSPRTTTVAYRSVKLGATHRRQARRPLRPAAG